MTKHYHYNNAPILVPRAAEVSAAFRPWSNSAYKDDVQRALDELTPWESGEDPIYTFELARTVGSRVVQLADGETPLWGVNRFHKANNPGLSPFILLNEDDDRKRTKIATLELRGTPQKPVLTRVYPGDYSPPLPWMRSVNDAPGGIDECKTYWDTHAYILKPNTATDLRYQQDQ